MNGTKLTQTAQEATDAFTLQREKLTALRNNSNSQDPNFIYWRMSTTEAYRHFLPDSEFSVKFESIAFKPGDAKSFVDETRELDPFVRGCNAAETCLNGTIEHIQAHGLDRHFRGGADAAAGWEVAFSEREQQRPSVAGSANDLKISFRIDGTPPSPQFIKMTANQPVIISLLEYLLPDERCIVSQKCSLEGESLDLPLSEQSISDLYNAPRPAGSTYESSVKFRVTVFAGGRTRTHTFRANLAPLIVDGTVYQRVLGFKDFARGA
jgi:hypothetical protein